MWLTNMHCECKALLVHFTFDNRHLGVSKLIIYTGRFGIGSVMALFHCMVRHGTMQCRCHGIAVSLSVEEVQMFFSLIAEEWIQRELDDATPKEKALCITLLLNLLYFQSMFSVYIFTSVSVFCFN